MIAATHKASFAKVTGAYSVVFLMKRFAGRICRQRAHRSARTPRGARLDPGIHPAAIAARREPRGSVSQSAGRGALSIPRALGSRLPRISSDDAPGLATIEGI